MNYAVVFFLLAASGLVAIRRGLGGAYAFVYVPVLLLMSTIRPVSVSPLPDLTPLFAVCIGGAIGAIIGNRWPVIRFHWIDAIVVALSMTMVWTAGINGNSWTVVSTVANELLRWLLPYLMARAVFREAGLRRYLAFSVSFLAMALGVAGMIEWRLWPLITSRTLQTYGLSNSFNVEVLKRYHFFRAMVTTNHPIDYGNIGFLMAALIVAMATTAGVSLRDKRILAGIGASVACTFFSMSFSSLAGLAVAVAIFAALRFVRRSEALLVPGVLVAICAGVLFTQHLLAIDLATLPRPTANDSALDGSLYMRTFIVQNAWNRAAKDAGLFGFGDQMDSRQNIGLESVDNSYMLFLIRRGWLHLGLRLGLAVAIAALGSAMLKHARGHAARTPPAALVAALIGTMAAMYTVWFGFVYAQLWTALLAFAVTMRQVLAERAAAAAGSLATPPSFPASMNNRPFRPTALAGRPMIGMPAGRTAAH